MLLDEKEGDVLIDSPDLAVMCGITSSGDAAINAFVSHAVISDNKSRTGWRLTDEDAWVLAIKSPAIDTVSFHFLPYNILIEICQKL